jgi:hypothetical protein
MDLTEAYPLPSVVSPWPWHDGLCAFCGDTTGPVAEFSPRWAGIYGGELPPTLLVCRLCLSGGITCIEDRERFPEAYRQEV